MTFTSIDAGAQAPRALLIFPTKALAHDQLGKLRGLLSEARDGGDASAPVCPGIRVDTLDGDTAYADRPGIVAGAHVILTNPDMLHVSILPQHKKFAVLLRHLAFVVVDEAHMCVDIAVINQHSCLSSSHVEP